MRIVAVLVALTICLSTIPLPTSAWTEWDYLDSDGDGIWNAGELMEPWTSPYLADTDGDGLSDGYEVGLEGYLDFMGNRFLDGSVVIYWDQNRSWDDGYDQGEGWFRLNGAGPDLQPADDFCPFTCLNHYLSPTDPDSDDDGLSDGFEMGLILATDMPVDPKFDYGRTDWLRMDPTNPDSDADGMLDSVEVAYGLHLFDLTRDGAHLDFDDDGVSDQREIFELGTDPKDPDTDGDGAPDGGDSYPLETDHDGDGRPGGLDSGWETFAYSLPGGATGSITYESSDGRSIDIDHDGDGLTDLQEIAGKGDPTMQDSDQDGLDDGYEDSIGTNPFTEHSDDDLLSDADELLFETDPLDEDSDDDGLLDHDEFVNHTDPNDPDPDLDGLTDLEELEAGTNPFNADTDFDGLSDLDEINTGWDPLKADNDGDYLDDSEELAAGTDPNVADTDLDGLSDAAEIKIYSTDPLAADGDGDNLNDASELAGTTNPFNADTDGDGELDDIDPDPVGATPWPWTSSAYLTLSGPSEIRANGTDYGEYEVIWHGSGGAGQAVSVNIDEPGTVLELSGGGGATDANGAYRFAYTPDRRLDMIFAVFSITVGGLTTGGEVMVAGPSLKMDVGGGKIPAIIGFPASFYLKVVDDAGVAVPSVALSVDPVQAGGPVTFTAHNDTHWLGEWTPDQQGLFHIKVEATLGDMSSSAYIGGRVGQSPLEATLEKISAYYPTLRKYDPAGVAAMQAAAATLNASYYSETDPEVRADVEDQAEALEWVIHAYSAIYGELRLISDATAALLLPTMTIDFAINWIFSGLGSMVPDDHFLLVKARDLATTVHESLLSKLGGSEEVESALAQIRQNLSEKAAGFYQGKYADSALGNIKVEFEKDLNQAAQENVSLAVIRGVSEPIVLGFAADITTILGDTEVDEAAWHDDAVTRVANARQNALDNTAREGLMSTIGDTSGSVSSAAGIISAGLTMTGIGAPVAAVVTAISEATATLTFISKAITGLNHGLALVRVIEFGSSAVSAGQGTKSGGFVLPASMDPLAELNASHAAMQVLGDAAANNSLAAYTGSLSDLALAAGDASASLSQASSWIQSQIEAGEDPRIGNAILDSYLELSVGQLEAIVAAWNAHTAWDDTSARAAVTIGAAEMGQSLDRSEADFAAVLITSTEPDQFSPQITATAYSEGTDLTISVELENPGALAGDGNVSFLSLDGETLVPFSIGAGGNVTVIGGPFATKSITQTFSVGLVGHSGSVALSITPSAVVRVDPVITTSQPSAGETLNGGPTEVTFWIIDGSGGGAVDSVTLRIDGTALCTFRDAGLQSCTPPETGWTNGTHNATVTMITADGSSLDHDWSFITFIDSTGFIPGEWIDVLENISESGQNSSDSGENSTEPVGDSTDSGTDAVNITDPGEDPGQGDTIDAGTGEGDSAGTGDNDGAGDDSEAADGDGDTTADDEEKKETPFIGIGLMVIVLLASIVLAITIPKQRQ